MKATITIAMGNAAFDEHPPSELARILRQLADNLAATGTLYLAAARLEPQPLRDVHRHQVL